jgi:hypothetical protein
MLHLYWAALGLRLQARTLEAALDGTPLARFQFQIGKQFDGGPRC